MPRTVHPRHVRQTEPNRTAEAGQDTDAFVAKLDGRNGTRLWGWQGGSAGNDYANAVAVDPSGDIYACGAAPQGMFDDAAPTQPGGKTGAGTGAGTRAPGGDGGGGDLVGSVWSNDESSSTSRLGGGGGAVADMFVAKVGSVLYLLFLLFFVRC